MEITVFQALTLLAQKYRHNTSLLSMIASIYLSGITSKQDSQKLLFLLKDELLQDYKVMLARHLINSDPVRRYFESHLAHNTLAMSLDDLDLDSMNYHYEEVCNEIKTHKLWQKYDSILHPPAEGDNCFNIRMENLEGMRILKKSTSYESLSPTQIENKQESDLILAQRKTKMLEFAKISYASWFLANMRGAYLPLNLYDPDAGHYSDLERGRKSKRGQTVQSQTLGIMRSYMPLPKDDVLLSNEPARYVRPADLSTYIRGAKQAEQSFQTLVTPFCNSISGTLLCQLQVIAEIVNKELFVYKDDEEQLKLYFKSYISYMLLHSGGHTLDEYVRVFWLPEVQEKFSDVLGFSRLKLDSLFRTENAAAFTKALDETIVYNQQILNQKRMSEEMKQAFSLSTAGLRGLSAYQASEKRTSQFFRAIEPAPAVVSNNEPIQKPIPSCDVHEQIIESPEEAAMYF